MAVMDTNGAQSRKPVAQKEELCDSLSRIVVLCNESKEGTGLRMYIHVH